ncbi:uncharacterized protein LOC118423989 isoform X2 [Branchiostoma floridae]|uniref:Uncharacterized protein LOC118423989 isoform X2 n=1 Tax=Branchiostoma floridae TaxID=7739 RepID=A0A9J7LTL9_BRAFL|nr:uncharacterized protein LOC118423989 isoform X2 [Branchiostoma floridae]
MPPRYSGNLAASIFKSSFPTSAWKSTPVRVHPGSGTLQPRTHAQVRSLSQESDVVYQDLERLHARDLTPSLSEWLQGRVSTKKSAQRKFLARKIDSPKARARKKAAVDAEKRLNELAYTNRMFRASVEQMMGDPAVVDDTSAVETVARHNASAVDIVARHSASAVEIVARHSASAVETVARNDASAIETVARHVSFHLEDGQGGETGTDADTRPDGTESREQELDAEAAE